MPSAQTTAQKFVKHALRWTTPLLVLAALGGTTMDGIFATGRIWSGRPRDGVDSPDHRYRAYVYLNNQTGRSAEVIVAHQWHRIYLGRLSALSTDQPVDRIAVTWLAADHLLIRCDQCDRDRTEVAVANWGRLHFTFDLGRESPLTLRQGRGTATVQSDERRYGAVQARDKRRNSAAVPA